MVRKRRILVVDDEPAIQRLVRATLRAAGYEVDTAGGGEEALAHMRRQPPDLVVLDVLMPGLDGLATLRRIREGGLGRQVPVILLTARAADADKVHGLQAGADDYLTKPFNPDELAARVEAVLRRTGGAAPVGGRNLLRYPGLDLDLDRRRATVGGEEARLSRTEWELLAHLAGNAGRVMGHDELLTRVWGPEARGKAHYLRTWVGRLRAKLEADPGTPPLVTTFPGVGYRWEAPPADGRTVGPGPERAGGGGETPERSPGSGGRDRELPPADGGGAEGNHADA